MFFVIGLALFAFGCWGVNRHPYEVVLGDKILYMPSIILGCLSMAGSVLAFIWQTLP